MKHPDDMTPDTITAPSRRRFGRAGLAAGLAAAGAAGGCAGIGTAAGGSAAMPAAAAAPVRAAGTAPLQTAGPTLQGGLSPRLTIHVLDIHHGTPAAGLRFELSAITGERRTLLRGATTNPVGRTDEPLLVGDTYRPGTYELLLHADEYFAQRQASLPTPPFLAKVPIRFRVADAGERIHLPVLLGPWSYSYYRGS